MIIATRILRLIGDDGDIEVPVTIHMPVEDDRAWRCDVEIGWPRLRFADRVLGVDAVQALQLAMLRIGIQLEASQYHRAGLLIFEEDHPGYGFPIGLAPEAGREPSTPR
jgi:hypothetical protein